MKLWRKYTLGLTLIVVFVLPNVLVAQKKPAGQHVNNYKVFPLPDTLGGTAGAANGINDLGWPMGYVYTSGNVNVEAAVWIEGRMLKLGPLPGGANSDVAWESVKNNQGLIVGISDTSELQPRGEIFSCAAAGFIPLDGPSPGHTCRAFLWEPGGNLTELPTLGGDNGFATGINNPGQVIGWGETTYEDPTCNSPQVLQFLPFVYDIHTQQISALQVYPGDSDGTANAQNDSGQISGISGICSNAVGGASAIHAVFWENANSTPIDMGNLGGLAWNTPSGMNKKGEVVGFGNTSGDQNAPYSPIAFYWSRTTGMINLESLPGFPNSAANAINNEGLIVGEAFNASSDALPHAFIYQNGIMTDLNALMIGNKALTLLYANDINDEGMIVGGAYDSKTNTYPAFVAIPWGDD